MDDQNTPSEPVEETEATQPAPEPAPPVADPVPLGPNDSEPANTPPTAPESLINADSPTPVEDQNGGVNQPESEEVEAASASVDSTPDEVVELAPNTSQESNDESPTSSTSEPTQSQSQPTYQPLQPAPAQPASSPSTLTHVTSTQPQPIPLAPQTPLSAQQNQT